MLTTLEESCKSFLNEFGIHLHYAYCNNEIIDVTELSNGELLLLKKALCKDSFLRGRTVLKKLCRKLSISLDTSLISFPNDTFSLTHSKHHAIAIMLDNSRLCDGVGIDVESIRPLNLLHASYFLNSDELVAAKPITSAKLTQLWTIKESLFKSDGNLQDADLTRYKIDIQSLSAIKDGTKFIFRSYNLLNDYYLSIGFRIANNHSL